MFHEITTKVIADVGNYSTREEMFAHIGRTLDFTEKSWGGVIRKIETRLEDYTDVNGDPRQRVTQITVVHVASGIRPVVRGKSVEQVGTSS